MNFDWTEQEQVLRDAVAPLFDEATQRELDEMETADPGRLEALTRGLLSRLGEVGYLKVAVGEAGRGEIMRWIAAQEVVAQAAGPLYLAAEVSARLFGGLIADHGTEAHKSALLAPLQAGTLLGAVAGSDAEDGQPSTAVIEGDEAVVTATKAYVTNGPVADWLAVVVQVDGAPAVALVPRNAAGLTRGERLETLGYRGLAVCPVWCKQVRIPRADLLGPFPDEAALAGLRRTESLVLAGASVGLATRAFEAAKAHAQTHQRGGKEIIRYQEVRYRLAELLTLVQTAQLTVHRAGWLVADVDGPEARDAETVVRCAKVFAAEASEQVATASMQVLAGRGFLTGNPVERAYRDAKYAALAGTTSEVCRMQIAAELLERHQP